MAAAVMAEARRRCGRTHTGHRMTAAAGCPHVVFAPAHARVRVASAAYRAHADRTHRRAVSALMLEAEAALLVVPGACGVQQRVALDGLARRLHNKLRTHAEVAFDDHVSEPRF